MWFQEAGAVVKCEGGDNDLIERIRADPYFTPILGELDSLLEPSTFIGRAPEQVDEFIKEEVEGVLQHYQGRLQGKVTLEI